MINGIYEQIDNSCQKADRKLWSSVLLLVISLIMTIGAGGCASTTHPANGSSSPASSSNSPTPPMTGAVLAASTSDLSFGDVQVGTSTSQLVTLTNTGNSSLKISAISVSGTGFTISGNANTTLTPNQSANIYVNFVPAVAGSASGAVTISSDATNSLAVSVSGVGASKGSAHVVSLSWTPSSSNVVGYFVDRSTDTGGPYTRVTTAADANPTFTDASVASGTYYYVVSAVDSSNVESRYSNEVEAIVP